MGLLLAKYKHKYTQRHRPISNIYLDSTKYFCKNIFAQKQIFICETVWTTNKVFLTYVCSLANCTRLYFSNFFSMSQLEEL